MGFGGFGQSGATKNPEPEGSAEIDRGTNGSAASRAAPPRFDEWGTADPARPSSDRDFAGLSRRLLDETNRLFDRYEALFALRALRTKEAVDAIGLSMLTSKSPLLRHEAAYVLGQMQDAHAVPALEQGLRHDVHVMVRHEAAEALGNIDDPRSEPLLRWALQHDRAEEVRKSCVLALENLGYLRDGTRLEFR